MAHTTPLVRHILDARPNLVDLTAEQCDWLAAYVATLPPLPPPSSDVRGSLDVHALPSFIMDPAEEERRIRKDLEFVLRWNQHRLAHSIESKPGITVPNQPAETEVDITLQTKLAMSLRRFGRRGKIKPALLVEAMIGKKEMAFEDLADVIYKDHKGVHGDRGDDVFRKHANAATKEARRNNMPLIYEAKSGRVFKDFVE
jgi:hypothetical protein